MALFHRATNSPSKADLVNAWLFEQPWCLDRHGEAELTASFHLDDPDGTVGMQVFVVTSRGHRYQVPLTYRDAPLVDCDHALIGTMEHSVLGTRYVYDGLGDDRFLSVLAGTAVSGYGQALGFASHGGRWYVVPDEMLVRGHQVIEGPIVVDGFARVESSDHSSPVFVNDTVEMTFFRQLDEHRGEPDVGLTATWRGQASPVSLVSAGLRPAR